MRGKSARGTRQIRGGGRGYETGALGSPPRGEVPIPPMQGLPRDLRQITAYSRGARTRSCGSPFPRARGAARRDLKVSRGDVVRPRGRAMGTRAVGALVAFPGLLYWRGGTRTRALLGWGFGGHPVSTRGVGEAAIVRGRRCGRTCGWADAQVEARLARGTQYFTLILRPGSRGLREEGGRCRFRLLSV